jgi:hypothetical protein
VIHNAIAVRRLGRRRLAALITGGSVSGFLAVHLVHLAAASAATGAANDRRISPDQCR